MKCRGRRLPGFSRSHRLCLLLVLPSNAFQGLLQMPAARNLRLTQAANSNILYAKSKSNGANSEVEPYIDLDELWSDETLDQLVYEGDEPDMFLDEDDLSLLYEIEMPRPTSGVNATRSDSKGEEPKYMSIQDLGHLASDLSYFYLRDELGLGEDVMWKITNNAGSVLMMKVSNIRKKVELLRKTIKLSDDELRQLLSAKPELLHLSANKNLSPTILFLLRQLDLGTKDLRTLVLGCPALLTYAIPNLQKKLKFFQTTMGLTVEETRKLLLEEPKLMKCSVNEGFMPRYRFLLREVNIPREDIVRIIKKNPRILAMSVSQNLQPKIIFFFIMTLMMTPNDVRKLLLKYPGILDYNLESTILPLTRYFLSLDISAHEISSILLKFPRLVNCSLAKVKHVVGYLRFELGLDADGVRKVLYQAPEVVGLSSDNLEGKLAYISDVLVPAGRNETEENTTDYHAEMLAKVIVGMPSLLHLNVEKNLKPKVEYLTSKLGKAGLARALDRMPMLLAYSLDNRIKPRLEMILDANVDGGKITVGIPKSERDFLHWLDASARKAQQKDSMRKTSTRQSYLDVIDDRDNGRASDGEPRVQQIEKKSKIMHWTRPRRTSKS
mmetsp:Transcript_92453/g.266961  ORF Transcript_92453/g.266961 Transcript_92453/m.266961 type:complete len:610 (-) Transcript_92453:31-1860(-)